MRSEATVVIHLIRTFTRYFIYSLTYDHLPNGCSYGISNLEWQTDPQGVFKDMGWDEDIYF